MKTYLFDFDGTLVDSMPTFAALMMRILDERSISYGDDLVKIITPLGYGGTAKYFREKMGVTDSEEELISKMNEYALYEYTYNVPAKEGVAETLKKMKELGYSLNVLTASPHTVLDPCLKRLGLYDIFSNVWSCEDFSTTKADPNIYILAAERMGVEVGDVIFVDDNMGAVGAAMAAGAYGVGIYDRSSEDYKDEFKKTADKYVEDFSSLI
jgi:HAD superfamily hydrolase (TIGR01509 family)